MARLLAAAAMLVAVPAAAQTVPATPPASTVAVRSPSPAPSPVDPARLAVAIEIAAKLLPAGMYKEMMGGGMREMMGGMVDTAGHIPLSQLAAIGGLDDERAATLGDTTLGQTQAIIDPHYAERARLQMSATFDAMGDIMTSYEPRVRAAIARALARRFPLNELSEQRAFFATPAGDHFARGFMSLYTDPEMMTEMTALMPDMMERLPEIMRGVQTSTSSLPPPRRIEQLSPAERAKLARLLGVRENQLRDLPPNPSADLAAGVPNDD